jgi:predicted aspartyl protease
MESQTMGRVVVKAVIENVEDLLNVSNGTLAPEKVRRIEMPDALVDTGASTLSLPKQLIDQLGLRSFGTRRARTSAAPAVFNKYGVVRLTILDRDWTGDVIELPDDFPVLIGPLPLEALDLVVDMGNHRVIGNPAHGGEYIIDMF